MKVKKIFLIFIIFLIFFNLFVFNNSVNATMNVDQLKQAYPNDSKWTGTYIGTRFINGVETEIDASECAGFAALMYSKYYGIDPYLSGDVVYDASQIQAGDIVRYKNDTHSVWVTTRSGNNVTIAECNWDYRNSVRWDRQLTISDLSSGLTEIIKAPYVIGGSEPALTAPSNIRATIFQSGIHVSWNKSSMTSGYEIKIFSEQDVKSNNFSNPVYVTTVRDPNITSKDIYYKVNGTYYVYVYTLRGDRKSSSGGSGVKVYNIPVSSIQIISNEDGDMVVGEKRTFYANFLPQNNTATNKAVEWSTTNQDIATVDNNGVVTAKKEGSTYLYAKSNGITAKKYITISYTKNPITSLSIEGEEYVLEDETIQLTAKILPENATGDKTITWSSSNPSIAVVNNKGVVTGISEGFTKIKATSVNGISATHIIIVEKGIKVDSINLSKTNLELLVGESETINATVLPSNATNSTVTWTSSDTNVATVNSSGKITAKNYGTTTITAKAGGVTKTCKVRVYISKFKEKYINLRKGSIDKSIYSYYYEAELQNGGMADVRININNSCVITNNFTMAGAYGGFATITGYDERYGELKYICFVNEGIKLSDNSYKFAGDLNGNFKFDQEDVTLLKNIINGGYLTDDELKLCDINGDGLYNNEDITLLNKIVKEKLLKIEPIEIEDIEPKMTSVIKEDQSKIYYIKVSTVPEFTTEKPKYIFSSSNTSIATVKGDGEKGEITVLNRGLLDFYIETSDKRFKKSMVYIFNDNDITKIPIKSVSLNKTSLTLNIGESSELKATINPSNTTYSKSVEWNSSNVKVATVSNLGKVIAKSEGTTIITVKTSDGKIATCTVTVKKITANQNTSTNKNSTSNTNKNNTSNTTAKIPIVSYRTHVENIGWQNYVKNGATAGTSGQGLRLEGINIKLEDNSLSGNIEYCTHVQNIGWQNYVKNGAMSGTSGKGLRLEAIKIRLTGDLAKQYDIYYRVHCQNFGWMGWAKNGAESGSAGYGYRLEAIQIKLVKKNENAPGSTANSYRQNLITYQTHVQNLGWQGLVNVGEMSGTSGQSLRLEGIKINLNNLGISGNIEYCTHVQNIGWQNYVKNGAMSGTSGKGLRLEAIKIRLTGDLAKKYDVYYRVHCENFGWMGWAKNGAQSGSAGYGYRLEGIEIVLVEKGGKAPGSTANSFRQK